MKHSSPKARLTAAFAIARKDLTILRRDRSALFSLLGIPLMFATFFGSIFGGMTGGDGNGSARKVSIAVVTPLPNAEAGALIDRLVDSGSVDVLRVDGAEARRLVRTGERSMFLEVLRMPEASELLKGVTPEFRLGVDPTQQATRGVMTGLLAQATFQGLGTVFSDPETLRGSLGELSADLQSSKEINVAQRALLKTAFDSFDRFLADAPTGDGDVGSNGSDTRTAEDSAPIGFGLAPSIDVENVTRERRRRISSYDISFPQAIAWGLMGAAAALALSLVKEARAGTLQRLRTTPIDGPTILLGKTMATAIAGVSVTILLLLIGMLLFEIRVADPIATGLAVASSGIAFAALGTFLGTLGRTEEAVSGASWGILLVFAMLGGGMVPEVAMPDWMKDAALVSPVRWSIRSLEGASWRAFELPELLEVCGVLLAFAVVFYVAGNMRMRMLRE